MFSAEESVDQLPLRLAAGRPKRPAGPRRHAPPPLNPSRPRGNDSKLLPANGEGKNQPLLAAPAPHRRPRRPCTAARLMANASAVSSSSLTRTQQGGTERRDAASSLTTTTTTSRGKASRKNHRVVFRLSSQAGVLGRLVGHAPLVPGGFALSLARSLALARPLLSSLSLSLALRSTRPHRDSAAPRGITKPGRRGRGEDGERRQGAREQGACRRLPHRSAAHDSCSE